MLTNAMAFSAGNAESQVIGLAAAVSLDIEASLDSTWLPFRIIRQDRFCASSDVFWSHIRVREGT
jgi:hypothetical protein